MNYSNYKLTYAGLTEISRLLLNSAHKNDKSTAKPTQQAQLPKKKST